MKTTKTTGKPPSVRAHTIHARKYQNDWVIFRRNGRSYLGRFKSERELEAFKAKFPATKLAGCITVRPVGQGLVRHLLSAHTDVKTPSGGDK